MSNIFQPQIGNPLIGVLKQSAKQMIETAKAAEIHDTRAYKLLGVSTYSIILRNEVITTYAVDTIGAIMRDKSLYRYEVKKAVQAVNKLLTKYSTMVGNILHQDDEMLDTIDNITDQYRQQINNYLLTFYYSLKQEMDSRGVEGSALRANIEFVYVLLEIAEDSFNSMQKSNVLLSLRLKYLDYLRLTQLRAEWKKLQYQINERRTPVEVDLNTQRCYQACTNLQKAMNDFEMISNLMLE